jgi:hypothetical protein
MVFYSKATFLLEEIEGGAKLTFTQIGLPDDAHNDVKQD